jgi:hypothetical protein
MKTKLLKKVRKRFEIVHMPKGFTSCGERFEYNLYRLTDSNSQWYERYSQLGRKDSDIQFQKDEFIFQTESECIDYLRQCILDRLRSEGHRGCKDHSMEKAHKKVWYK